MPGAMTAHFDQTARAAASDPKSEDLVLAAITRSPAPVLAIDSRSRVLAWNEAGARAFDLDNEGRGKPLSDVLQASASQLQQLWAPADAALEVQGKTSAGPARLALLPVPLGERPDGEPTLALLIHLVAASTAVETAAAGDSGVTTREREVLRLLASGKSTLAIAGELGIARTTARNHIQAILGKLEAHSRLEAVARARVLGLVS